MIDEKSARITLVLFLASTVQNLLVLQGSFIKTKFVRTGDSALGITASTSDFFPCSFDIIANEMFISF